MYSKSFILLQSVWEDNVFPVRKLLSTVKSSSVTQRNRTVPLENAYTKCKNRTRRLFPRKTKGLNKSFPLIESNFGFLDSGVSIQGNNTLWPIKNTESWPLTKRWANVGIQFWKTLWSPFSCIYHIQSFSHIFVQNVWISYQYRLTFPVIFEYQFCLKFPNTHCGNINM